MRVDVRRPAGRAGRHVAVDRRLHNRVVDKRHPLLAKAIPAARILLVGLVEFGVGSQSGEKRGLVIRRAAEPAIGQPRPSGDRIARGDLILGRARCDEVFMSKPAPIGRAGQHVFLVGVVAVQRIVQPGDHPRRVAEPRMLGDLLYALAVDPYLPAVVEAVEKFLARIGKRRSHAHSLPVGRCRREIASHRNRPQGTTVRPALCSCARRRALRRCRLRRRGGGCAPGFASGPPRRRARRAFRA
jgi:hypothetical protein